MRRLFRRPRAEADTRPALLSVIALMAILVPMLLVTSSLQRTAALPLGVPGPGEELPPEVPGAVERLRVARTVDGFAVTASVRNTDVLAGEGDTEERAMLAPDLSGLQEVLATFKVLDPQRRRITLAPAAGTTADEVVRWMDAVRYGPSGELYPQVILEAAP